MYSRTLVTQTLKGNEKQFEVAIEGSSYRSQLKKKLICHVAVTFLIKGKEIQFELNRVEMTGKWGEIQAGNWA